MHMPHADDAPPPSPSILAMVQVQDHLLSAGNDLGRLETLLEDACSALMARFHQAAGQVQSLRADDDGLRAQVAQQIGGAITALQFQDMASQLINHTCRRLRHCADVLANEIFRGDAGSDGDDEGDRGFVDAAPLRPNPVTQSEMNAGAVELF